MRPGGHKKGHSQIGESAHAHPLPPGGVIAIGRPSPKFSGAAKWTAQLESIDSIQERIDRVAEDFKTGRWLNGAGSENGPDVDSGGRSYRLLSLWR